MARRRRPAGSVDPFADLEKKAAILERELAQQREAMERLKQLASRPLRQSETPAPQLTIRKSA